MVTEQKVRKKRMTPGRWAALCMAIVVLVVGIGYGGYYWLSRSYPATVTAQVAALGSDRIKVDVEDDYYHIYRGDQKKGEGQGLIFYPGARVEEDAYCPLLSRLASVGYDVYMMKMPFHMACFKIKAADEIAEGSSRKWIMMGHSLGGTCGANYAATHPDRIKGLVFLASYSVNDLTDLGVPMLSIYGSRDQVLNMKRYEAARKNLPKDLVEHVIIDGNHSNYGYYGLQKGDGEAGITPEEQQEEVVDLVTAEFPVN